MWSHTWYFCDLTEIPRKTFGMLPESACLDVSLSVKSPGLIWGGDIFSLGVLGTVGGLFTRLLLVQSRKILDGFDFD